jgi:biofilm PGA synthesis lipoprotein PgaB
MTRLSARLFILFLLLGMSLVVSAGPVRGDVTVFCYHDVKPIDQGDLDPDSMAVSPANLLAHFDYLHANGFHPVSMDDLIAAREGRKPLPEKAVMLTFDDGYLSFYTEVYPLLKLYRFPAVLAIVGSWTDTPEGQKVRYGNELKDRSHFATWRQIKEMQDSGLVEIASHSFDLHKGISGNPAGSQQYAAITRQYGRAGYERDDAYRQRIRADLERNSSLIAEHLGKRPRVMVWPFGAHSRETQAIARSVGMPYSFTLVDDKPNRVAHLDRVHRILISANPPVSHLAYLLNAPPESSPTRAIHVDLDYVYDADPRQVERNLDRLIERVSRFQINTVFLQAFSDPDGNGEADALYFPNRYLPVRDDLFGRVAWQLRSRTGVNVYAWMPVLAFDLGDQRMARLAVRASRETSGKGEYRRLSPFSAEARAIVRDIYADLGRYTKIQGVLFHDDAYLRDDEDAHPAALSWYRKQGLPEDIDTLRADPKLLTRWTRLKTDHLIAFTHELTEAVRRYQPDIRSARNLYARPVLESESEQWFAQQLEPFVEAYDLTAIMAMPYMEGAEDPNQWLARLADEVKGRLPPFDPARPGRSSLAKVMLELQARDWRSGQPVDSRLLHGQVSFLLESGFNNIGYYPDDFHNNQPDQEIMNTVFSLRTFPYLQR